VLFMGLNQNDDCFVHFVADDNTGEGWT